MSVLQRIELNFWHLVIPLTRESRLIRFLLQRLYAVISDTLLGSFVIPAMISALFGLFLGYIGGLVSSLW
ncbi:MAG: hypothetical protein FJ010_14265 [Chloroflexi bacterium]|nr:hypothetical protein [Chloroflexota bacterium]